MPVNEIPQGGSFLLQPVSPDACFTPEDIAEEDRMIKKTTADFVANEVVPNKEKIETQDCDLIKSLLAKAGKLGLLGADIPQQATAAWPLARYPLW